ncbi:MAG: SDR family oxidoreductase [Blastocatellia bacterium]|nr:SDR family oxidoreductase [Blastocatellia bacterium]
MSAENNRVALVTGAYRGIGHEICKQLAQLGITVVLTARSAAKGEPVCEQFRAAGLDVHFHELEVTNPAAITDTLDFIDRTFGRLDILVNNAAIPNSQRTILELHLDTLEQAMASNVYGPFLLMQGVIPLMKRNGYGRIVNISSGLGSLAETANPDSPYATVNAPAYRITKTALNALTVSFSRDPEIKGQNILVNSCCPGWVKTVMGGEAAPLTVDQGAITPVWLATLPDDGPTGGFFREKQPIAW